ncbi:ABC transporter ATP-binding protein [Angustibacter sp. McL0619]|uniref:ABC transporter ATP-binding protein n=1 Tax=Angustibacter sp. McL0619 TaxID=3415676 RepID=UPI003CF4486A
MSGAAAVPTVTSERTVAKGFRPTPPLAVSQVGLVLKGASVLRGVTFDVQPGSAVALLGRNGAGKSSLLQTVAHLRRPTSGTIAVDGAPAGSARARTAMAVVLQDVEFPVALRVGELLDHVARHYPRPRDPQAVGDRLGLTPLWSRRAGGLSGGEERRLALACALVGRPRLVLLDEPTAGLDRSGSEQLWTVLDEHVADGGAVLFSTHQLAEVEARAQRVLLLDAGTVVADEPPQGLVASLGLTQVCAVAQVAPAALTAAPGCTRVSWDGVRCAFLTSRPDDVVRWLVHSGIAFRELTIEPLGLPAAIDELLRRRTGQAS